MRVSAFAAGRSALCWSVCSFSRAGVMLADPAPPADNCDPQKCEEKVWFVASPSGTCYSFETAECAWCWQGRCTKTAKQPTTTCLATTKQIKHFQHPGNCTLLCNLNLNSYSEAAASTSAHNGVAFVTKHACSN